MKFYFDPRRAPSCTYSIQLNSSRPQRSARAHNNSGGISGGAGADGFVVFGMMCERKQTRGNLFSDETILFRAHKERIKVAARQKPADSLSLTWR